MDRSTVSEKVSDRTSEVRSRLNSTKNGRIVSGPNISVLFPSLAGIDTTGLRAMSETRVSGKLTYVVSRETARISLFLISFKSLDPMLTMTTGPFVLFELESLVSV